jgi:hypothetical protein
VIVIRTEKSQNALAALNAVLVAIRKLAYDRSSHEAIAEALDSAEYLPRLIAEAEDASEEFRQVLVGLAQADPRFNSALERYDNDALGKW